ncbi:unnamed protein product [Symbiodinium microadriaticum]|nr:unnamed protein product [Symbiodinium microadriaticum]
MVLYTEVTTNMGLMGQWVVRDGQQGPKAFRRHGWRGWLEEYGDPDDSDLRPLLRQISAYHLAQDLLREEKAQRMPEVLFTTSTRDDRVHPCHARKMVELLQSAPAGQNVFLFEGDEGGHGGAAIFERAFIRTLEYEFLWARLEQG